MKEFEDFFGGFEGARVRRVSPLLFDLLCKLPIIDGLKDTGNCLYWNYEVKSTRGSLVTTCYAKDFKEAVYLARTLPRGAKTIQSFHDKIVNEFYEIWDNNLCLN
jgi:hypothetical protein